MATTTAAPAAATTTKEGNVPNLRPECRVQASVVGIDGRATTEQVRVVRLLDQQTLLVQVEASLATPTWLLGATLPISTSALRGQCALHAAGVH